MGARYYRLRDLTSAPATATKPAREGRYPVAASTIWRWVARGDFPEPVKLASGTTAWPAEVVEQWESQRGTATSSERQRKAAAASVERRRGATGGEGAQ